MPALLSSGGLVVIQKSKLVLETMVLDTEEQSTNNRKLIIGCVTLSREVISKTSHFLFEIINYCYTFRETIKRLNMKNSTITLKLAGFSNVQEVYYPLALLMGYRVVERHIEMT